MSAEEKKIKQYDFAFQLAMNEGNLAWSSSSSFILANTIIIGFMATQFTNQTDSAGNPNIILLIIGSMGLMVSILWFVTFKRRWKWYQFRVKQASLKEEKLKGKDWVLLSKEGKDFSDGKEVKLDGEKFQQGWSARNLGTANNTSVLIFIFVIFYLCVCGYILLQMFFIKFESEHLRRHLRNDYFILQNSTGEQQQRFPLPQ